MPPAIPQGTIEARIRVLREQLLAHADLSAAAAWGSRVPDAVNDELNDASCPAHSEALNFASSLVTRALIARGILHVAADWWTSVGGPDRETALKVLQSIIDELPPQISGGSYLPKELVQ